MAQIRRNNRFYIENKDYYSVKIEVYPERYADCILNDISVSGACIILSKEIFLQREKPYSFEFLEKNEQGEFQKVTSVNGKMVWYLHKEFRDQDMLYLGIEFQNEIGLPESITTQGKVKA